MGILRRRAAALAVGVTLASSAGAARTAPTTTPDRRSTADTTTATTKRIRSETAAVAAAGGTGAEPPSSKSTSVSGLRGSFADGGHGAAGQDDELAGKLMGGLDGSAREDLASQLIAGLGKDGAAVGGDEEFAATLAEAFGSRGREGELAEKLLAGLGEGGERQQLLAAKLLAGLDVTHHGGGGGGARGGGRDELGMRTGSGAFDVDVRGGRGAGPAENEEGNLWAAVAEALDSTRRQETEEGGKEGGGLEHILTRLVNLKEEEEELPLRGLVREPAWRGGGAQRSFPDGGDGDVAPFGFVNDLPTATAAAQRGHEGAPAAVASAGGGGGGSAEEPVVESLPSQLSGAFRKTFGGFLRPSQEEATREGLGMDPAALAGDEHEPGNEDGDEHGDALAFGEVERAGRSALGRRRLQTSSDERYSELSYSEPSYSEPSYSEEEGEETSSTSSGNTGPAQIEIVTDIGATSSDWNGAYYTLEVGDTIPGQTLPTGKIIARGTISEGESPSQRTENLERGCYVIYTSAGTRPYDVQWELQRAGELYQDVAGGGQDFHTFGVNGALCGMSECYQECFEANDAPDEVNDCGNFGDLLAPPDETAGHNCTCTEAEEIELRLRCLKRGCDSRGQCYLLDDSQIVTAPTLTIVSYVQTVTNTIDVSGMETAVAQWLDLDPSVVDLVRVNGLETSSTSLASRRRLGGEGEWEGMGEEREEWQRQARNRRLQTAFFKRLEFRIIGESANDFPFITTLAEGVLGLQAVLRAQDEASGVQQVTPYTAVYSDAEDTKVARADIPGDSIAGSGGGTGVDEEGEVIIQATDAPTEFGDFTTSTQFLIGAGLVVVVSFFLCIVACVVCRMKRRDRKEFERKNAPEDGRRKPVAYVDPWGSVARTFQKDSQVPGNGSVSGGSSTLGGQANGSAQGIRGSRTANSSASA